MRKRKKNNKKWKWKSTCGCRNLEILKKVKKTGKNVIKITKNKIRIDLRLPQLEIYEGKKKQRLVKICPIEDTQEPVVGDAPESFPTHTYNSNARTHPPKNRGLHYS